MIFSEFPCLFRLFNQSRRNQIVGSRSISFCGIPAQDIITAAHCLQHDARLLTNDGHFAAVPGLKLAYALDELT